MGYFELIDKSTSFNGILTKHQSKWIEEYNYLVSVLENRFEKKKKIISHKHKNRASSLRTSHEIEYLDSLIKFFDLYYDKETLCFNNEKAFDSNIIVDFTETHGEFKDFTPDRRAYNYQQHKLADEIKTIITEASGNISFCEIYDEILEIFPHKTYDDDELDILLDLYDFSKKVYTFNLNHKLKPNRKKIILTDNYLALYDKLISNPLLTSNSRYFLSAFIKSYPMWKKEKVFSLLNHGYSSLLFTDKDIKYISNKISNVLLIEFHDVINTMAKLQKKSFA